MLIGSPLGVMTAATIVMITMAWRRQPLSCLGVTTPAISRATSSTGNSNPAPNASIMNTMSFT